MVKAKKPLSKSRVIDAAIKLADTDGLGAVTMRNVAQKLSVEAMSLYHHVANKDEMLDAMSDAVFAEIQLPEIGGRWREQMEIRCHSMRDVLVRHPWSLSVLNSRTSPGLATLHHHDAVIGCLRAGGLSVALTAHAFAVLDSYVYGFVLQQITLPIKTPEDTAALAESIMGAFEPGEFVHLVALANEHVLQPGYSFPDEFNFGLELLLDGIARRHKGR